MANKKNPASDVHYFHLVAFLGDTLMSTYSRPMRMVPPPPPPSQTLYAVPGTHDDETLSFMFKRKFNLASAIQKKKELSRLEITFSPLLLVGTAFFFDVLIALESWKTLGSRV